MIEIFDFHHNVTCVKTASPLGDQAIMWVYAYLIGDTLLDAGCKNAHKELQVFAKERDIKRVMVTHAHEDHYGGCAAFKPRARIFADPVTKNIIQNPPALPKFFHFVWGQPAPLQEIELMPSTFHVDDLAFEIIPLPGHCKGMVGFWEKTQKWLFSADAVPLPSRKQMAMPEENIPQMILTMEKIQSLPVKVLFDGHRGPIEEPKAHIQTRIDYLRGIQAEIKDLHQQGKAIEEIQETLKFPEPWYLQNTERRFGIDYLIRSLLEDHPD